MSAFMASSTPEQPGYDPVDTTELPMWIVVSRHCLLSLPVL